MCGDCLPGRLGNVITYQSGPCLEALSTTISTFNPKRPFFSRESAIDSYRLFHECEWAIRLRSIPLVTSVCPCVPSITGHLLLPVAMYLCINRRLPLPPVGSNALPSLDSIFRIGVPTLHHVPKAARDAWAGDVLLSTCSDPTDVDAWVKFFLLPRCILANPARGGHCHWHDTLKNVHSRIAKWRAGEFAELWQGGVSDSDVVTAEHPQIPLSPCVLLTPARLAMQWKMASTIKPFKPSLLLVSLKLQTMSLLRC